MNSIAQWPGGLGSADWHTAAARTIAKGNQWRETNARRVRIEQLDAYLAALVRLRDTSAWEEMRQLAVSIDEHFHDEIQSLSR